MESVTILEPEKDPLGAFCMQFLADNPAQWPTNEDILVKAFLAYFKVQPIFDIKSFSDFCVSLGIEVSTQVIPKEMRVPSIKLTFFRRKDRGF